MIIGFKNLSTFVVAVGPVFTILTCENFKKMCMHTKKSKTWLMRLAKAVSVGPKLPES